VTHPVLNTNVSIGTVQTMKRLLKQ